MPAAAVFALIFSVAVLLLIGWIVVRLAGSYRDRTNAAWGSAAERLGVDFHPGSWTKRAHLSGVAEGVPIDVRVVSESSGQSSSTWTSYRASYPGLGLGLNIRATGGWQRFSKLFGAQDIATGDEAFDPEITVKGDDPEAIKAFLTPSRRMSAHRLVTEYPRAVIEDDGIRWRKAGIEKDADALVTHARRLAAVAKRLTGTGSRGAEPALAARAEGDPGRSMTILSEQATGSTVEDRLDEAEAAYAGGRFDHAADVLAGVEQALPADKQVAAWRRRSEERRRPMALPAAPGEPVIEDPAEVADALFRPGLLSFEASSLFEERFEGRRVRWSGSVVRFAGYISDLDFGHHPGTKAVIRVYRLRSDLYGGREVDAVVQLPKEAKAALAEAAGGPVTFEGTLVRADTLMRNLFVEDGRLVDSGAAGSDL